MEKKTLTRVRASSAPLHSLCPASAHGPEGELRIERVDAYGKLGTALHEVCAAIVRGDPPLEAQVVRDKYDLSGAETTELHRMEVNASRWWHFRQHLFPDPHVEEYLESGPFTGHPDLWADDGTGVRVVDWKSTRRDTTLVPPGEREEEPDDEEPGYHAAWVTVTHPDEYTPAMMEYLYLIGASTGEPDKRKYQYVLVFLRDSTQSISPVMTWGEVCAAHNAYRQRLWDWDGHTYHPGGHCWYCPRVACCQALAGQIAQYGRWALQEKTDIQSAIESMTDAQCVAAWDPLGVALRFLDEARALIKARAEVQPERVLHGDGKALVLEERTRKHVRTLASWPIWMRYLTPAQLAPAVSISKTVALKLVAETQERGQKRRIKEQIEAELEAAGAMDAKPFYFPRVLPTKAASNQPLFEG